MTRPVKYTQRDFDRANALPDDCDRWEFAQLIAEEREFAAQQCDAVAKGPSRSPSEKAVARQLAKRIREGRP